MSCPKKYRIMNSQKDFSGSSGSFLFTGCRGLWKKQESKMSAFPTAVSNKKNTGSHRLFSRAVVTIGNSGKTKLKLRDPPIDVYLYLTYSHKCHLIIFNATE